MMKHKAILTLLLCFSASLMAQPNGTWTVYNTKNSEIGGNNI